MSKIKVNSIEAATGSTITIPSGQTLDISSTTLTLPSTVVTTTGTQTLTNKTIGVSQLTGTLPVANGGTGLTALGTASQVLRVNSGATALEFATAPSGKVLQVVSMTTNSDTSTTSTTFVTTVLTLAITPSSASSKILILATSFLNTTGVNEFAYATIARGGTNLGAANGMVGVYADSDTHVPCSIIYLDSPSSTSSLTYDVRIRTSTASVQARLNQQTGTSSLILMEIGS